MNHIDAHNGPHGSEGPVDCGGVAVDERRIFIKPTCDGQALIRPGQFAGKSDLATKKQNARHARSNHWQFPAQIPTQAELVSVQPELARGFVRLKEPIELVRS